MWESISVKHIYVSYSKKDRHHQRIVNNSFRTSFPITLQCILSSLMYSADISMVTIVNAVCAGDTTAKLLTLAHSDLDYRLYLPLSQLIITQFSCLTEHPTAFKLKPRKHFLQNKIISIKKPYQYSLTRLIIDICFQIIRVQVLFVS